MTQTATFSALDEAAFEEMALRISESLEPGDVIVLSGEVGAGKTTLTRIVARKLGIRERVTSPTYQLAKSYESRICGRDATFHHLDLYRLDEVGVEDALDLDEYVSPDAVTFIEWADPALGVLENPSVVHIEHDTWTTRNVAVSGILAGRMGVC